MARAASFLAARRETRSASVFNSIASMVSFRVSVTVLRSDDGPINNKNEYRAIEFRGVMPQGSRLQQQRRGAPQVPISPSLCRDDDVGFTGRRRVESSDQRDYLPAVAATSGVSHFGADRLLGRTVLGHGWCRDVAIVSPRLASPWILCSARIRALARNIRAPERLSR
jgi:hypothetical protein